MKNKTSFFLLVVSFFIFSIGVVMIFNITSAEVLERSLDIYVNSYVIKQMVSFFVGISLGLFIYFAGYENIIRLSPFFLFFFIILLILVFVPFIGIEKNGAHRWLGYKSIAFQPSEFVKYLIPIYCIYYFKIKEPKNNWWVFLKFLLILSIPFFLILIEPDNGSAAIILASLVLCFFLIRIKLCFWAAPLIFFILTASIVAYHMPHVRDRIKIYINPEFDIRGKGHQPYQSKIAAGSGKLFGKGLGKSMQKLNYLPMARSDYIAAIYAEEFGFLGIFGLISLYLIITFLGFYIAILSHDKNGFYLASSMTFLISFQAFLNLGVVSAFLPSKGIALPFFSQGGTSLIVNIVAIFLILSVASHKKIN